MGAVVVGDHGPPVWGGPGEPAPVLVDVPATGMGFDSVVSADQVAEVGHGGLARWAVRVVGHGVVLVLVATQ